MEYVARGQFKDGQSWGSMRQKDVGGLLRVTWPPRSQNSHRIPRSVRREATNDRRGLLVPRKE